MPQAPAFYPNGIAIPDEKLTEAIKAGQIGYEAGTIVKMVGPDGKVYNAKSESVPSAFAQGYRPMSPQETAVHEREQKYKKLADEHPVLAGTVAAATTAADTLAGLTSLGASDYLRSIGPEVAPGMKAGVLAAPGGLAQAAGEALTPGFSAAIPELQKASPLAATTGTVAGAGLALGLGPGASALGAVGKAIPQLGAAGKALETAASGNFLGRAALTAGEFGAEGAIQGGTYAAFEEARRASMADEKITVERMLAAAGTGAGIGAIFGIGLGGLGSLGKSAFVHETEFAALRAQGVTRADIKKLILQHGRDGVKAINEEFMAKSTEAMAANKAGVKEFDPLSIFGGIEERAAANQAILKKKGQALENDIFKTLDETGAKLDWESVNANVNGKVVGKYANGIGEDVKIATKLDRDFITPPRGERINPSQKTLSELDNFTETWKLRRRVDKSIQKWGAEAETPVNKAMIEFRNAIETEVESQISRVAQEASLRVEKAKLGGEMPNPQDDVLSSIYDRYLGLKNEYHLAAAVAKPLQKAQAGAIAKGPLSFGDVLGGGLGMVHGAYGGGIHGGGTIVGGLTGLAISKTAKFISGDTGAAVMAKALNMVRGGTDKAAVQAGNAIQASVTANSVKNVIEKVPPTISKLSTQFMSSSQAPADAVNNPAKASVRISDAVSPITEINPKLGREATKTLAEDLKWLADKLPPGMKLELFPETWKNSTPSVSQMARTIGKNKSLPRVSMTDMARYIRQEKTLSDPIGQLLKMSREGKVPPELPEVLGARRPMLRQQLKNEYQNNIIDLIHNGKRPTHKAMIQASWITGSAMDITMNPQFIQMSQAVWAEEAEGGEKPQETPPTRAGGRRVSAKLRSSRQDRSQSETEDISKKE